ncbi:MaoC/PaaZ C-terminal domain-containing protein [Megasphaera paucivorans]|uniref:Acyl dehydratase n=1 Tax=Megasphaera paucivorans TaxID=349095 RepID=A0A1G9Z257_9FIRM|nr:MaoC/PaaZ C-terminal domain-containing protein [Megasphaera paucivorans]SDN15409.1 Acyl dehydratase [Megasphaera paucivorans]
MKIGIKYCGGCNSHYDRVNEVTKLINQFPQHTFVYHTLEDKVCDVWLIVCGCVTCCAAAEELIAVKKKFILYSQNDFVKVVVYLKQMEEASLIRQKKLLHIGESVSMVKKFTISDITNFSKLAGNYGKVYVDENFASYYDFKGPVVHEILLESFISTVMTRQLPGEGAVLIDKQVRFPLPVYLGNIITATVILNDIKETEQFYIGEVNGCCKNETGNIVLEGIYHQMMIKKVFCIAE